MLQKARARAVEGIGSWFSRRPIWLAGAAVAAAPVVAAFAYNAGGWVKFVLAVLVGLLAVVGFAVPAARAREAERRADQAEHDVEDAKVAMRTALSDYLLPTLGYVVSGIDDDSAEAAKAEAVTLVLSDAASLCRNGEDVRTRACWYELQDTSDNIGDLALIPKRHYGRGLQPSTRFDARDARGRDLLMLLSKEGYELWPDLRVDVPKNWKESKGRGYETFLVVSVRSASEYFGIITVDADKPGVLTQADVDVVRILGWVLALALGQARRRNSAHGTSGARK